MQKLANGLATIGIIAVGIAGFVVWTLLTGLASNIAHDATVAVVRTAVETVKPSARTKMVNECVDHQKTDRGSRYFSETALREYCGCTLDTIVNNLTPEQFEALKPLQQREALGLAAQSCMKKMMN